MEPLKDPLKEPFWGTWTLKPYRTLNGPLKGSLLVTWIPGVD